ncbi:MAG: Luciferase family protein [Nitrosopumilales archaeon]|nr:MAG: Luciferase family protein [Nitrosopumilales archaeon]
MRLGYSLGSLLSVNEVLECAKILSTRSVDSIWIPETWGMEGFSMMSAVSRIAKNAKIGSSIVNIYSRSPSVIAMGAATLDTISEGKLILGLGTSSDLIVQYVEIIRLILSKNKVNYNGKFFHLKDFALLIKPTRNKIPVYLAAVNQKMVELTWNVADGVIFYLRPFSELKDTIQKMQSKKKIDVASQFITCVSDDKEKAVSKAKKTLAFYISVAKIYRDFLAKNGFKKETENVYQEFLKSGLTSNFELIPDSMLESLTICGDAEESRKQLKRFVDAGVNLPIMQFNPIGDAKESFEFLVSAFSEVEK